MMNERMHRGNRVIITVMIALFALGAVTGVLLWKASEDSGHLPAVDGAQVLPNVRPVVTPEGPLGLCAEEVNVIRVAQAVGPSVVTVLNLQSPRPGAEPVRRGLGSGFVVRSDGLIVTNAHVIAGATRVNVLLLGERALQAQVLGSDPRIDIAVLRIEAQDLSAVPLGDSDNLLAGQQAIAIGNPLGFERTVTMGVVSALNRAIPGGGTALRDLIQTDAAIYPGNSGGPLLDSCGRAIGVNTAVVGPGQAAGGLGFAVPINTVKNAINDVLTTGRIRVPWIGIAYTELTPQMAQSFRLPVSQGLVVGSVVPRSPAARAGIQEGDIIIQLNGREIGSAGPLQEFIRDADVGQRANLTILRDGERRNISVTLEEMPREVTVGG